MAAIEAVTRTGPLTPDLGGTATTAEVTAAVCRAIEEEEADRCRQIGALPDRLPGPNLSGGNGRKARIF